MRAGRESAVTPLLGGILMLAVSVAGTGTALMLGAPVLERLQEQAALDTMVGQFGVLHASQHASTLLGDGRSAEVGLPRGQLRIEPGTSWLVSLSLDGSALHDGCDFQVLGWEDGDDLLQWETTLGGECRTPAVDVGGDSILIDGPDCYTGESGVSVTLPLTGSVALPALACFEAHALPDLATNLATSAAPCTTVPTLVASCATGVTLAQPVGAATDWRFRLTDGAGAVFAEAWLLRSSRLHWDGGRVAADLEAGAVVAHGRSGDRVAFAPRVDPGLDAAGPSLLVLPTFGVDDDADVSGAGPHTVTLSLQDAVVRHQATAYRVRVDLAGGPNAQALCEGLLAAGPSAPVRWQADGAGGACGLQGPLPTAPPLADGTVSLVFDPPNTTGGRAPSFLFTHMAYRLRLGR